MKGRLLLITLVSLSLLLIGCGQTSVEEEAASDAAPTKTESQETEAPPEADVSQVKALVDQDLLDSIEGQMPGTFIMVQEASFKSMDGDTETDMSSTIKMTMMDDYSKMEMSSDMMPGTYVTIYNPDTKTTYQYNKEEGFGMKFEDVEGNMNQLFETEDDPMDMVDLEEIKDVYGNNFTAREEMYNGEKVIYIETQNMMADGTEMKMWYSTDFFIPLKYEVYSQGQLMMSSQVTDFDAHPNLSPANFEPPADIEFQDMNMNMNFEMPSTE